MQFYRKQDFYCKIFYGNLPVYIVPYAELPHIPGYAICVLSLFQNRNELNFKEISTIYIRQKPKTMPYSVTYLLVNYDTLISITSRFGLMARIDKHASKTGRNWILDRKAQY